jgi:phosphate transport system protein
MLQEKIITLKKELLEFATLVESMLEKCIRGLMKHDARLLDEVINVDEPKANESEIHLDEYCTTTIAQSEPKAKDLRTILMILKMNNDLERMADHVVNIAESAQFLIERPSVKPLIDIPTMANETKNMLHDSIDAFINEKGDAAQQICLRDNVVDGLKNQISRELITYMSADPGTIERGLHLIRISNNLERIADLATNICEDVVFIVEGKIIKHHHADV